MRDIFKFLIYFNFQFPYPPPQASEPTKTLKSLVNIRKESVRFVKAPAENITKICGDGIANKGNSFNIEFVFDSDAKCAITIYYFCSEETTPNGLIYSSRDSALTSETYHFKRGVNQLFSQNSHIFNPTLFSEDDLVYTADRDVLPIAIHCVVEDGPDEPRQSHTTICVIDRHADGTFALRAMKQKIFVDGLCYLLQEIYGIENKNINKAGADDDTEDNGSECVICMCDTRDTLILPCRHLCLCNSCADSLRYQANNCPICRAPFRALLQIRAVQKNQSGATIMSPPAQNPPEPGCENIPAGYTAVSLIEALNGPAMPTVRTIITNVESQDLPDSNETAVQAAEILNRKQPSPKDIGEKKEKINQNTPEFRMSVLLSKEDGSVTKELLAKHSPLMSRAPASRDKNPREKGSLRPQPNRDNVKLVNEKNLNPNPSQEQDEDSDNEKLSPLLNSSGPAVALKGGKALHMDGVEESIDDTDTDLDETECDKKSTNKTDCNGISGIAGAEDSDYYTPEDPHTTILSPLYGDSKSKENISGVISSPLTAIKESAASLPGRFSLIFYFFFVIVTFSCGFKIFCLVGFSS